MRLSVLCFSICLCARALIFWDRKALDAVMMHVWSLKLCTPRGPPMVASLK